MAELAKRILYQILGAGGLAYKNGLTFSEMQYAYACAALAGFLQQDPSGKRAAINCLEAGTGTGKTLGFLVPALIYSVLTGERVIVSTFSKYLQRQIIGKDALLAVSLVEQATGRRLSFARRVGRGNFVSEKSVMLVKSQPNSELNIAIDALIDWLNNEECSGIVDDFMVDVGIDLHNIKGLSVSSLCLQDGEECPRFDAHVNASKQADLLVVNHALLSIHACRWLGVLDSEDFRSSLLIVDEAEHLPEVAAELNRSDVAIQKALRIVCKAEAILGSKGLCASFEKIKEAFDEQERKSSLDFVELLPLSFGFNAIIDPILSFLGKAKSAAKTAKSRVIAGDGGHDDLIALGEFADTFDNMKAVGEAMRGGSPAFVSFSPVRRFGSIIVSKSDASLLAPLYAKTGEGEDGKPVIESPKAILFTSATLAQQNQPVAEAFDGFLSRAGVIAYPKKGESQTIHLANKALFNRFHPKRFGNLDFVLAAPDAPKPFLDHDGEESQINPQWVTYTCDAISEANKLGRTLVLSPSYKDCKALGKEMEKRGKEVILHRQGEKLSSFLAQFVSKENAVLISPAAWEGVDLPGMIKALVVARIPFAMPDSASALMQKRAFMLRGMAEKVAEGRVTAIHMDMACRKLNQGFGRPVRSANDTAVVFVTDPRFPLPTKALRSLKPEFIKGAKARRIDALAKAIPARFKENFDNASYFVGEKIVKA